MEEESQDKIKERKEKILKWIKDPYNATLVAILIFAFIIRLYYFLLTSGQALWWDEACYGALAKNMVYHIWDGTGIIEGETAIRPFLFPFLFSLLIRLGTPEIVNKFILEFIPSMLSVFLVYLITKELYAKRIALISTFIFSVLWIHLFYTLRFLTNVPAMVFLLGSIYFFIRFFKSKDSNLDYKSFLISLILLSIATLIRYPIGIFFIIFFITLIIEKKLLLKDPKFWTYGILGCFPLFIFFLFNFITYGNIFPALLGGDYLKPSTDEKGFGFHVLNFIPIYLESLFFIFFIAGIVFMLFNLFLGYDVIFKNRALKNHFFILLILVGFYSFFIFYLKEAEDRWLFPASISLVIITGIGIDLIYKSIKKYNKQLAVIGLIFVIIFGGYLELKQADNIIKLKATSYLQERQAFEWLDKNTPQDSLYAGSGISPYTIYYTNREYYELPRNREDIDESINPNYLIAQIFHTSPSYFNEYIQNNSDKLIPIKAFYMDKEQTQPAAIIYKVNGKLF